jgi:hypothetical protein
MSESGWLFDVQEPPPPAVCRFCGQEGSAPDHARVCDGRQGRQEALHVEPEDRARADKLPSFDGAVRGQERRDTGMGLVEEVVAPSVQDGLAAHWQALCEDRPELTSDDLWRALPDDLLMAVAAHPNVVGAFVRQAAASRHWTVDTGRVLHTRRANGQARKVTVWRSLLYRGAA